MILSYRAGSPGYWTAWLLPTAIILSGPSFQSLLCIAAIAFNTLFVTLLNIYEMDIAVTLASVKKLYLFVATLTFSFFLYDGNDAYATFTHISLAFAFPYVFYNIVHYYPRSFTFGEALIATQAFLLTFWYSVTSIPIPPNDIPNAPNDKIILLFAEAGFLGILIASRLLVISTKPWVFLFTEEFFCMWAKCCLVAMGFRLTFDDVLHLILWLAEFLSERAFLFLYCLICSGFALRFLHSKKASQNQASTADRKYFHFLIVAVYLPGILFDREFLFLGSAALTYIFVLTELVRSLRLKVFGCQVGDLINDAIGLFRDRQDEGRLILTPLYLLAGCSVPIWLIGLKHPTSNLNGFDLAACLSGVFSIGVGDTFASIGGTKFRFGNRRWRGTSKTVCGSMFCLISQVIFMFFLHLSGLCSFTPSVTIAVILAAFINSLVEAFTDQIDNLILPLLTFDIIVFINFIVRVVEGISSA